MDGTYHRYESRQAGFHEYSQVTRARNFSAMQVPSSYSFSRRNGQRRDRQLELFDSRTFRNRTASDALVMGSSEQNGYRRQDRRVQHERRRGSTEERRNPAIDTTQETSSSTSSSHADDVGLINSTAQSGVSSERTPSSPRSRIARLRMVANRYHGLEDTGELEQIQPKEYGTKEMPWSAKDQLPRHEVNSLRPPKLISGDVVDTTLNTTSSLSSGTSPGDGRRESSELDRIGRINPSPNLSNRKNRVSAVGTDGQHPFPTIRRRHLARARASRRDDQETVASDSPNSLDGNGRVDGSIETSAPADDTSNQIHRLTRATYTGVVPSRNLGGMMTMATTTHSRSLRIAAATVATSTVGASHHRSSWRSGHNLQYVPPVTPGVPPPPQPSNSGFSAVQPGELARSQRVRKAKVATNATFTINSGPLVKNHPASPGERSKSLWPRTSDEEEPFDVQSDTLENTQNSALRTARRHRRSGSSPAPIRDGEDHDEIPAADIAEDLKRDRNGVYAVESHRPGDGLMLGQLQSSDFKPATANSYHAGHQVGPKPLVFSRQQTQNPLAPVAVSPESAPMDELAGDTPQRRDTVDSNDSGPGRIVIGGGNNGPLLGPVGGSYPPFRPSQIEDPEDSTECDPIGLRGTAFTKDHPHSENGSKRGIHILLDHIQNDPHQSPENDDFAGSDDMEEATFAEESVTVIDGDDTIEVSVGSPEPSPTRSEQKRTPSPRKSPRRKSRSRDPPEGPREYADRQSPPPTPTQHSVLERVDSSPSRGEPIAIDEQERRSKDESKQLPLRTTPFPEDHSKALDANRNGGVSPKNVVPMSSNAINRTIVNETRHRRAPTRAKNKGREIPQSHSAEVRESDPREIATTHPRQESTAMSHEHPGMMVLNKLTSKAPMNLPDVSSPATSSRVQDGVVHRISPDAKTDHPQFKGGLVTDIERMKKAVETAEQTARATIPINGSASPVKGMIAIVEPFPSPDDRKASREASAAVDDDDESWKRAEEEWRLAEEAELEYHLTPLEEQEDDTLLDGQQLVGDTLSSPAANLDSFTTDRGAPLGADEIVDLEGTKSYGHSPVKSTQQPKSILKQSGSSSSSPSLRIRSRDDVEQGHHQPMIPSDIPKASSSVSSAVKSDDEDSIFVFSDDDEGGVRTAGSAKVAAFKNGHHGHTSSPENGERKPGTGGEALPSPFRIATSALKSSLKSPATHANEGEESPRSIDSAAHRAPTLFRSRRKGHNNAMVPSNDDDDDDTSLENYGGHPREKRDLDLQARTQQAWSVRNKNFNSQTTKNDSAAFGRTPERVPTLAVRSGEEERTPSVAFAGADKNTVHHFHVPESDESESTEVTQNSSPRTGAGKKSDLYHQNGAFSDDDTATTNRSGASGYSRPPGNDIENFVKDLFFIGSGRRTYPRRRRRSRSHEGRIGRRMVRVLPLSSKDMGLRCCHVRTSQSPLTIPHVSSTTDDANKLKTSQERSETTDDDWTSREDVDEDDTGVRGENSETTEDLPPVPSPPKDPRPVDSSSDQDNNIGFTARPKGSGADTDTVSADPFSLVWSAVEDGVSVMGSAFGFRDRNRTVSSSKQTTDDEEESWPSVKSNPPASGEKDVEEGWMDYASDLLLGPPEYDGAKAEVGDEPLSRTLSNQSENPEADLYELAKCAARAKHEINGLVFDESELDVVHDLKFSVITVALPLGLLFQENSSGCWVARVFESGNAANAKGDGVEVGDQIAAINGTSATKMRAEEVCHVISSAPNPTEIELTFLRYVGRLRPMPGTIDQEGYEVGLKKQPLSRRLSPARLFNQVKKKPDTPEPGKHDIPPPPKFSRLLAPNSSKIRVQQKSSEVQEGEQDVSRSSDAERPAAQSSSKAPNQPENKESQATLRPKAQGQPEWTKRQTPQSPPQMQVQTKSMDTTHVAHTTATPETSVAELPARPKPQLPARPNPQPVGAANVARPETQTAVIATTPSNKVVAGSKKAKKRFGFFGRPKKQ